MATSYVESAILRVRDESTKPIRKINHELKKLMRTAKDARNMRFKIQGLEKAKSDADRLTRTLRSMPRSKTITLSTRLAGSATGDLNTLVGRRPQVNIRPRLIGRAEFEAELRRLTRNRVMRITAQATGGQRVNYRAQGENFGAGMRTAFQPFNAGNTMGRGFIGHVGATLSGAIIEAVATGIREGVTDFSVSEASRSILGVTPDDRLALDAMSTALSDKFPEFNQGQIERILTDAYGAAQGDITITRGLIDELLTTARQTFLQGQPAQQATEGGNLLFTAAEATGITDAEGNIDLTQLAKAMEDFRVGAALVGEAFTPSKTKTFFTRLSAVAPRFDRDAIAEGLLLQEAGVTANDLLQFVRQFGTEQAGTDEAKAFRAEAGLGTREAIETADRNQIEFFQKFLIPAFERAVAKGFEGDIGEFVSEGTSRQTAARSGQVIAIQGTEISNRVDRRDELQVGGEDLAGIAAENQRAIAQSLASQFDSAISRTVEGMAPVLNPIIKTTAKALNASADLAEENPAAAAAGLAASTLALSKAVAPLGRIAGIKTLLDPDADPGTKALAGAAIQLDSAANKLEVSALALLASSKAPPGGFIKGLKGLVGATVVGEAIFSTVKQSDNVMEGMQAYDEIEKLESLRKTIVDEQKSFYGMFIGQNFGADYERALSNVDAELARLREREANPREALQSDISDTEARIEGLPPTSPELERLNSTLESLNAQLANPPEAMMLEPAPDLAGELQRPIRQGVEDGAPQVRSGVESGAPAITQAIIDAAPALRDAVSQARPQVDVRERRIAPQLGAPLGAGDQTPF